MLFGSYDEDRNEKLIAVQTRHCLHKTIGRFSEFFTLTKITKRTSNDGDVPGGGCHKTGSEAPGKGRVRIVLVS